MCQLILSAVKLLDCSYFRRGESKEDEVKIIHFSGHIKIVDAISYSCSKFNYLRFASH